MVFKDIFKNSKVLITGHTGFKGSWLSLWLHFIGAKVEGISVDLPSTPSHFQAANLDECIIDHRINIKDLHLLREAINTIQPDFIFHLAAQSLVNLSYQNPINTFQINTIGTGNLLEVMKDYGKKCSLILITSDKCYLNKEWLWGYKETDELGGFDPYSASKAATEILISSYINSFFPKEGNVRIGIARAGNVIGGGDWAENRIVPDCMRAASEGKKVELRKPNATRPWQHVLEPLSGYITLAKSLFKSNNYHGEAFNFGPSSMQVTNVGDLVNKMKKYWDDIDWLDASEKNGYLHESGLLKLNCDKAYTLLDWKSKWDIDVTLEETVRWYKEYYTGNKFNIRDLSLSQIEKYENNT